MLSTLRRNIVKTCVAVAVLASVMGIAGFTYAPTAHAEPISCSTKQIGSSSQTSVPGGYYSVSLYAAYSTYDNSYCGYMWTQSHVHLNPGAPWGTLTATLYDCNNVSKASASTAANGGGSNGYDYWATTGHIYISCGQGKGTFTNAATVWTGQHWG